MARKPTIPLAERLARFGAARDVSRALDSGIDRLPVSDLTRTILKVKSGQAVAGLAETGAALARGAAEAGRGAAAAAKEGVDEFHRSKQDLATPPAGPSAADTGTGTGPAHPAGQDDLTVRLERLSALHAAGHLDDREYGAAKAKVLGLEP